MHRPTFLTLLALCAGTMCAAEQAIPVAELPQAVKDTVAKLAPGRAISEAEREDKNGVTRYEVELAADANGKELELVIAADGTLISQKEEAADQDEAPKTEAPAK